MAAIVMKPVNGVLKKHTVAFEVAVSNGATSVTVTFSTALASASYQVIAQLKNVTDTDIQYQPVSVTNQTTGGFTAKWNAPVNSANYVLVYHLPEGIR